VPRFLLVGHAGFYNLGCEAIVRATLSMLRERWPGCEITLASADHRSDQTHPVAAGVTVVPHSLPMRRYSPLWFRSQIRRRVLRDAAGANAAAFRVVTGAMRAADAVLSIGGDNYSDDYGSPDWLAHLDGSARLGGVPNVVWGASIGPFREATTRDRAIANLRLAALITARETCTRDYLAEHGVTENVRLVADPAFLLEPEQVDTSAFWPRGERILGLNVSPLLRRYRRDGGVDPFPQMTMDLIRTAVSDFGMGVLLVPHVVHEGNNDHAYMAQLSHQLGDSERVCLVPSGLDARQTKYVISRCDALLAARTHATIAGFSTGVPTISLAYSQKAVGINRDLFGDERWVVDTRSLRSPNELTSRLGELLECAVEVRAKLTELLPCLRTRARSAVDHLASVLE